jgi:hypothetical protein
MEALEKAGHVVVPASSLESCLNAVVLGGYRLLLIGATVPWGDRQQIATVSKRVRPESHIISVEWPDSPKLKLADHCIEAGHELELIKLVMQL